MHESQINRMATLCCSKDDKELERLIRDGEDGHVWIDLLETILTWQARYASNHDYMRETIRRLFIVLDRIYPGGGGGGEDLPIDLDRVRTVRADSELMEKQFNEHNDREAAA